MFKKFHLHSILIACAIFYLANSSSDNVKRRNKQNNLNPNHIMQHKKIHNDFHLVTYWHERLNSTSDVNICSSIASAILNDYRYHMITGELITPDSPSSSLLPMVNSILITKVYGMQIYIDQLPEKEFVLFTDTADVLYQNNPNTIISKYWQFIEKHENKDVKVIFNCDNVCWPMKLEQWTCPTLQGEEFHNNRNRVNASETDNEFSPKLCTEIENKFRSRNMTEGTGTPYLNSGVYFGRAKEIGHMLKRDFKLANILLPRECWGDQAILSFLYANDISPIAIDHESTMFFNIYNHQHLFKFNESFGWFQHRFLEEDTSDKKQLPYFPYTMHFAGMKYLLRHYFKRLFDSYVKRMGYAQTIAKLNEAKIIRDYDIIDYKSFCNISDVVHFDGIDDGFLYEDTTSAPSSNNNL